MKKDYKKFIFGFILGGLLFGSIGVVALTLTADQIEYTPSNSEFNVNNTKDAIDELYAMTLNNNKNNLVSLGTGTQFDLSTYSGYENFTEENFIVGIEKITASSYFRARVGLSGGGSAEFTVTAPSVTITKTYDASTGILTISPASKNLSYSAPNGFKQNGSQKYEYFAYLIY